MSKTTETQTYLVGGAVRDELLGYPFHERDWVVVGATPQAMLNQGYQQVGKDFPVYLHPETKEEYALARTERKNGQGYTGFACYAAPDVTLEQDLERRDLTINAIAKAADGTLTDPYGGAEDIAKRVLRHVSPAFEEDPLRVLRTARFAARYAHLGFAIAQDTLNLMQKISESGELTHLAAERVFAETEKGLSEQSPTVYIESLLQCGALAAIAPAWASSLNNHVINTLKNQQATITQPNERFALLCLNLASTKIAALSDTIRLPNDWVKAATNLVEGIELLRQIAEQADAAEKASSLHLLLKKLDCQRRPEQLAQFIRLALAAGESKKQLALLKDSGDAICQIQAKELIAEGFTGAVLGKALAERQASAISALIANTNN